MIIFDLPKNTEAGVIAYDEFLGYLRREAKRKFGSGEAFALKLGHKPSWWSNIVNERRGLSVKGLFEIAAALGSGLNVCFTSTS